MTSVVLMRRLVGTMAGALVWVSTCDWATACPFCTSQGQTLTAEVEQASMVLFGTLSNARLNPDDMDFGAGTTDLTIEAVIKPHEVVLGRKVITLPRYVPVENKEGKFKYLVFCDVFKGKIDPYRGLAVKADSDIVKYLQGALAVKDKSVAERLKHFFQYLDNPDIEISNDAYKEFGNSDYKDFAEMAPGLPADKIAKWLEDPSTPPFRYGLYASMLGHCGQERHAALLRKMLDDPQKRGGSGVDGMLAGYIMLKPKEGWNYLLGILSNPAHEFMLRYAALRAARFFWDFRTNVVPKADILNALHVLLDQGDIADLAIEDLRKWQCWEECDRVLGLFGRPSHDVPIVRRAIMRYALSCPKPQAAKFVAMMRQKDAEWVKDVEELLKLEAQPAKPEVSGVSK
ncbi:MAG: hypothetical protein NZ700_16045 [Gemmataceae bacterium]|nr:hypothetical protein [Gemmataceae bacterium]MDW8264150.1 hypothetical protein [Gemmataceae bacterium]